MSCLSDKQLWAFPPVSSCRCNFFYVCLKTSKTEPPQKLCLDTSPLEWTVTDVVRFIRTTDCAPLARIFLDQVSNSKASTWSWIVLMLSDVASHELFVCLFRRSMDKHCCCWTSQRYKSAWIWSWDQPSSCATTSRGSSWRFTSSLPHSWRWTRMWTHLICYKSCERRCNCPFGISYTGYSIGSRIYQMEHRYFISLRKEDTQGPKPFRCC